MKNKTKDKIAFCVENTRLYSDARDTYYWIRVRDEKIADEYLKKCDNMEKFFDRKFKEEKEAEEMAKIAEIGKTEWGEPEKTEKENGIVKKTWWKRLKDFKK